MIKITVEIVPFGKVDLTRRLWEVEVSNIKTDANDVADYNVCWLNHDANKVKYLKVSKHKRNAGLARLLSKVFKKMDEEL
jgi:hypothetical protein